MSSKPIDAQEIYKKLKTRTTDYREEIHCPMVLRIMADKDKGTVSAFCVEAMVDNATFFNWVNENPLFEQCYSLGKMMARENWEAEGRQLKNKSSPIGMISYEFEHWKMMGWSRFGVSNKNSRVRLELNPTHNPSQHYAQLIKQAASGDFTAGELKQLMEAINVGLNTEQVFVMQKQIDELKADLATMVNNSNVQNSVSNKRTSKKD